MAVTDIMSAASRRSLKRTAQQADLDSESAPSAAYSPAPMPAKEAAALLKRYFCRDPLCCDSLPEHKDGKDGKESKATVETNTAGFVGFLDPRVVPLLFELPGSLLAPSSGLAEQLDSRRERI